MFRLFVTFLVIFIVLYEVLPLQIDKNVVKRSAHNHHDHHHHHNQLSHSYNGEHINKSEAIRLLNTTFHPLESIHVVDYFFHKYGNGSHIFFEALEHMWNHLGFNNDTFDHLLHHHKDPSGDFKDIHKNHDHDIHNHHAHDNEFKEIREHVGNISNSISQTGCLSAMQLFDVLKLRINQTITKDQFISICPFILSQLEKNACKPSPLKARKGLPNKPTSAWIGALISVLVISIAGMVVISIVPILSKSAYFENVVQFLISLAVGTLTSDALLHLLPHAMVPHEHGDHNEHEIPTINHSYVTQLSKNALWVGVVSFASIILFFIFERVIKIVAKKSGDSTHEQIEIKELKTEQQAAFEKGLATPHNHSHNATSGVLASAWMVAMGDGLHNFADGLAIGASFANSMSVGVSTSVAVLCHELPHELGDFASLLTAGMSIKQAIICNLVSSVLCLIGVCIGVSIGNIIQSLTMWVFAVIAGLFIYIALVVMLPQMTKSYDPENIETEEVESAELKGRMLKPWHETWLKKLLLHLSGVALGLAIMVLIGMYEDQIVIEIV